MNLLLFAAELDCPGAIKYSGPRNISPPFPRDAKELCNVALICRPYGTCDNNFSDFSNGFYRYHNVKRGPFQTKLIGNRVIPCLRGKKFLLNCTRTILHTNGFFCVGGKGLRKAHTAGVASTNCITFTYDGFIQCLIASVFRNSN